ncbi:MAG: TlpA family protein disulfide reductase [Bacteroidales bacterium]|nr:TlpA family protein disulfide reductase [Bacteroidales bacterium]MCF8403638.1 TlpA family protein disulfide reductase [Bacteroidales bacterium]
MSRLVFFSFYIAVSLVSLVSQGQSTILEGTIPGAENAEVRLMVYADQISYKLEILDRTYLSENGAYNFEIELQEINLVYLEIEYFTFALFLEPGGHYILQSDSISPDDVYRPYYNKDLLPAQLLTEPEPGLNKLINGFNVQYNEFTSTNFGGKYLNRQVNFINAFREEIIPIYEAYDHPFLLDYIRYKIASIELIVAPTKKPKLFSEYFENKPVKYNNPEYMDFFNAFFNQHITTNNKFIQRSDLISTINSQNKYPALFDSLGKDTLLRNEKIRELACLKTLKELYKNEAYSQSHILNFLKYVAKNSKFKVHAEIAENLYDELTHLQQSYPAPEFILPDLAGKPFALSMFKGKPVYLGFFTTWSYACLAEFELMDQLFHQYKNQITFISISLDKNKDVISRFKSEKSYNWTFLYNGNNFDLINDYRIKTFPLFVLIDKEGKVVQYPAYKPSEIISKELDKLLKEN